jgi:hypothetical protein
VDGLVEVFGLEFVQVWAGLGGGLLELEERLFLLLDEVLLLWFELQKVGELLLFGESGGKIGSGLGFAIMKVMEGWWFVFGDALWSGVASGRFGFFVLLLEDGLGLVVFVLLDFVQLLEEGGAEFEVFGDEFGEVQQLGGVGKERWWELSENFGTVVTG